MTTPDEEKGTAILFSVSVKIQRVSIPVAWMQNGTAAFPSLLLKGTRSSNDVPYNTAHDRVSDGFIRVTPPPDGRGEQMIHSFVCSLHLSRDGATRYTLR